MGTSRKVDLSHSRREFRRAKRSIPGGVNSPVRAFKAVGGNPLFITKAKGSRITDVDGNEFIDYVSSWGPMIFGHAHPRIVDAISRQAPLGTSFGAPTELETELAQKVVAAVPSVESVRLVSSGTEATLSALRLARGFTGRDKIVKFEGCYHGHADSLLIKAGSGALTLGVPSSPGVPAVLADHTVTLVYNDGDQVRQAFAEIGDQVACIIVEPVAGNMNCVPPADGFLQTLRDCCDASGSLLIFDEVMTGFRVGLGGAQQRYDIVPDLTTLGKVIGGGLPIGAYGGRADLMALISPEGSVYQAGTLSGNPLAVAAGRAMLDALEPSTYDTLETSGARLEAGLRSAAERHGVPLVVGRQGSMLCPYLSREPVTSLACVEASDREGWTRFFQGMLERGILLPPSPFEAWFLSTAHTDVEIDAIVAAADESLASAF